MTPTQSNVAGASHYSTTTVDSILRRLDKAGWFTTLDVYHQPSNARTEDRSGKEYFLACSLVRLGGLTAGDIKAFIRSAPVAHKARRRGDVYLSQLVHSAFAEVKGGRHVAHL